MVSAPVMSCTVRMFYGVLVCSSYIYGLDTGSWTAVCYSLFYFNNLVESPSLRVNATFFLFFSNPPFFFRADGGRHRCGLVELHQIT